MGYFRECQESNAQYYMDRRESPPASLDECPKCGDCLESKPEGIRTLFRCVDCHQVQACCVDCVLRAHTERPFDRICMWSVELGFWQKKTLGDLGFIWHIGHVAGGKCPTSFSPPREMVIIHEHGMVDMKVAFCQCLDGPREPEQLITHGCWPATWKNPHTAITLSTMTTYHGLELQAQLNVHDYVRFLRRQTDGVEPDAVKVRHRSLAHHTLLTPGAGSLPRIQQQHARVSSGPRASSQRGGPRRDSWLREPRSALPGMSTARYQHAAGVEGTGWRV